jgi:hypothetical protein
MPPLRDEVNQPRRCASASAGEFGSFLDRLVRQGLDNGRSTARFRQSLDILLGRESFVQQPSIYYFPELPQIQFYDRENFPGSTRSRRRPPTFARS